MECEKFRMKDCDGDLSEILQPYIADGRSEQYGALLVQKIPACRMRMPNYGPSPPTFSTPQATTFSTVKIIEGLYVVLTWTENWPMEKWMEMKIESASLPNLIPGDFIKLLESGQQFGTHAPDQDGSNTGFRRAIGIEQWPMRRGDPALKLAAEKMKFSELARPTVHILNHGAPIRAQKAVGNCHALYFVHEGQPVRWIVVPPRHTELLEHHIRQVLSPNQEPSCPQFVKHLRLWILVDLLKIWKIDYFEIEQAVGQLLCVFPGSYIWGYGTGYGILERKLFSHTAWKPSNDSFCSMQSGPCQIEQPHCVPPTLSDEDSKAIEMVSNQRKYKPRPNRGSTLKGVSKESFQHYTVEDFRENAGDGSKKRKHEQEAESYPGSLDTNTDPMLFDDIASITEDGFYFSDGEEPFTALVQVMPADTKDKEIDTLRQDVNILVTDRNHIHERKQAYKERLYKREKDIRSLEYKAQMSDVYKQRLTESDEQSLAIETAIRADAEPDEWRDCAMRAYHIIRKRNAVIEENMKTIQEREQTILGMKYQIEEIERDLKALQLGASQNQAE